MAYPKSLKLVQQSTMIVQELEYSLQGVLSPMSRALKKRMHQYETLEEWTRCSLPRAPVPIVVRPAYCQTLPGRPGESCISPMARLSLDNEAYGKCFLRLSFTSNGFFLDGEQEGSLLGNGHLSGKGFTSYTRERMLDDKPSIP